MSTVLDIINRGQAWLAAKPNERQVIIRRKAIDGIRFRLTFAKSASGDQGVIIDCVDRDSHALLTSPNWEVIGTCESYKEYKERVKP